MSGLVFGAAEAVHYFTNVLGSLSGNVNGLDLQDLTIQYIWRFLTDPIDHAMWAGITGYFIGLAITGQNRKYSVGLVGIAIAAVLHGLNDWNPINGHLAWVLITLISVLLFLGYARAGAWLPQQALASSPDLAPSPPGALGRGPGRPRAPGRSPRPAATVPRPVTAPRRCRRRGRRPPGVAGGLVAAPARGRRPARSAASPRRVRAARRSTPPHAHAPHRTPPLRTAPPPSPPRSSASRAPSRGGSSSARSVTG